MADLQRDCRESVGEGAEAMGDSSEKECGESDSPDSETQIGQGEKK